MTNKIIAVINTGSRVYGNYREDSDYDNVTILMPSIEHIIGIEKAARIGGDRSVYYIHDFVMLLRKGAVNLFELLFMEYELGEYGIWWEKLIEIRDSFASDNLARASRGFIFNHLKHLKKRWEGKKYAHIVRVIEQLDEYTLHGTMTFPRPNKEYLRELVEKTDPVPEDSLSEKYVPDWKLPSEPDDMAILEYLGNLYKFIMKEVMS